MSLMPSNSQTEVLQQFVDVYRDLPEVHSLTSFGLPLISAEDRRAARELADKGLLSTWREKHLGDEKATQMAQLTTAGAEQVVRLFKEGLLRAKD